MRSHGCMKREWSTNVGICDFNDRQEASPWGNNAVERVVISIIPRGRVGANIDEFRRSWNDRSIDLAGCRQIEGVIIPRPARRPIGYAGNGWERIRRRFRD